MLLLTFRAGADEFAVDARRVIEVVPRVGLRPIPHAPLGLAGLLDYRGEMVPVVDFSAVVGAAPSPDALSTRVILTRLDAPPGHASTLGIIAARVDQVLRAEDGHVALAGMDLAEAPYLDRVMRFGARSVQLVRPERLLEPRVRDALFAAGGERRA